MARLTLSEQLVEAQQLVAALRQTNGELTADRALLRAQAEQQSKLIQDRNTQLAEFQVIKEQLAKALKDLESSKGSYNYASQEKVKIENELEQAHAVLDGVEGAPEREYDLEYGKGKRNVVTRLAGAFLAIAKNGGTK